MPYSILLRPAAVRDLRDLAATVQERIHLAIQGLADDPRPPGSKKLVGFENEWRIRVGDYRVLYLIDDRSEGVVVARIAHRREAYR